jgi:hypothetical protein
LPSAIGTVKATFYHAIQKERKKPKASGFAASVHEAPPTRGFQEAGGDTKKFWQKGEAHFTIVRYVAHN